MVSNLALDSGCSFANMDGVLSKEDVGLFVHWRKVQTFVWARTCPL